MTRAARPRKPDGEALAYVSLGSNLGDRAAHFAAALAALRAHPAVRVEALSSVYETDPVGPPPQGPYLNAVVGLYTSLPARELLALLLAIESARGRERDGTRWTARSLDLDLLFYGTETIEEPGLRVPHPRLHERAFVLEPLCELAPGLVHPVLGATIEKLAARVRDARAVRRLAPEEASWRSSR
jgi:2-amino-4-hydroxy-6-hydroxymethyldihydropteridine diphosphokinase